MILKIIESIIDNPQKNINPYIWKNNKINSQIKEEIIKILNEKNIKYNKIYIIGSITTKYWDPESSDIDVDVIINENDENIKSLKKGFKVINERNYFGNFPINFFFNNKSINLNIFDAVYDVLNDKWIKKEDKIENIDELLKYPEIIAQRIAEKLDEELNTISDNVIEIIKLYNNKNFDYESKIKLLEQEILQYINEVDDVHKRRIEEFNKAIEENDYKKLKKYKSLNLLPANIIFKFLEKRLYFKIAEIMKDTLKNDEIRIKEVKELYEKFVKFWI